MARLPRLSFAGQAHHVLQRGHNGQPIFLDDDDRGTFLAVLRNAAADERVAVHGYSLLDNEVQLLATPATPNGLSRLMQGLGRRHGANFNRRHGHVGTLWSGRFCASAVEPSIWVLRCLRFIETASGRAGQPDAISSARHHIGALRDPLVSEHPAYWALGNTPFEREAAWRQLLEQVLTDAETREIAATVKRGWPLGGPQYLTALASQTQRALAPRPVGRPTVRQPD